MPPHTDTVRSWCVYLLLATAHTNKRRAGCSTPRVCFKSCSAAVRRCERCIKHVWQHKGGRETAMRNQSGSMGGQQLARQSPHNPKHMGVHPAQMCVKRGRQTKARGALLCTNTHLHERPAAKKDKAKQEAQTASPHTAKECWHTDTHKHLSKRAREKPGSLGSAGCMQDV